LIIALRKGSTNRVVPAMRLAQSHPSRGSYRKSWATIFL